MNFKCLFVWLLIAVLSFQAVAREKKEDPKEDYWLSASVLSGLKLRNIGPALMSGRISDIAVHPKNPSIWYITAGSGGVWKTENCGITWKPIFDKYDSYSIGCITIDPVNHDTLWLGTGENVSGRHVGYGDGVYKSTDGGESWSNMGLVHSEHIAKILVHPENPDSVFVAAEGPLWSSGGDRGLYKTEDGGKTWTCILKISKNTGVTDVEFEPGNPDIIYAAAYMRRRSVAAFKSGGPESGIYKSSDGGKNWVKLSKGLPSGDTGKIGIAVSPVKPEVVYATIEADKKSKGFYRSTNRGSSWKKMSDYISGGTGPHYYQEIVPDPVTFDRVYQMDVYMHVTENGGKTFKRVGEEYKHVDNHALVIDPTRPDHLIAGCDGGVYETFDRGRTWRFFSNLPLTQFYKVSLDTSSPFYFVHGGAQDNSSQMGPSRTNNVNGIVNSDWFITSGADGYGSDIHPDNTIVYCTWQNGSIQRYDRENGQLLNIKPQPENPEDIVRFNWDAPFFVSPHNKNRLYMGGNKLFKSDDNGNSWKTISEDLTRDVFRLEEPIMEKSWSVNSLWDHYAMSTYSTLTALSESPLKEGLIATGSDDGLIYLTENDGASWTQLTLPKKTPDRFFTNDLKLSMHNENTIYCLLDNHKSGDFKPYMFMSLDKGHTWKNIAGNLPERLTVWSLEEDHVNSELLFIGTEFGIYFTLDRGIHWNKLSSGVPTIAFRDLEIQRRENDLVGASFGRGFYILDDYTPLRHLNKKALEKDAIIFPVKTAFQYIEKKPLGSSKNASQGHEFYRAENPPYGAVITIFVKDGFESLEKQRKKKESALDKEGKTIPFPGWNALKEEQREEKDDLFLEIKDESGALVRKLPCKYTQGLQRVSWDLRYYATYPVREGQRRRWTPVGPMVVPGTFTASLVLKTHSEFKQLGDTISFNVESLGLSALNEADRSELLTFQKNAGELQRVMMGSTGVLNELSEQVASYEKAIKSSGCSCETVLEKIDTTKKALMAIRDQFYGDRIRDDYGEPDTMPLFRMLDLHLNSTSELTENTIRNYTYVKEQFNAIYSKLKTITESDIPEIEAMLEAGKVPWSSGRGLPDWTP